MTWIKKHEYISVFFSKSVIRDPDVMVAGGKPPLAKDCKYVNVIIDSHSFKSQKQIEIKCGESYTDEKQFNY